MDYDEEDNPHSASSRSIDGDATDVGTRNLQYLWPLIFL